MCGKAWGSAGRKARYETSLNKVTFLSPKCRDLCGWRSWRDWSFAEPQGEVKTVGIPGWPLIQRILQRPQPLNMLLSLSPGFSDRWGSGHKRRDKVEDPVFLRYGRAAVLAEKPRCRADRWMTLLVMDVQQLFTAATPVTYLKRTLLPVFWLSEPVNNPNT